MMDRQLAGIIARGIIWILGFVCQWLGYTFSTDQNKGWIDGLALFLAGLVIQAVAVLWSKVKDRKLLMTPPPSTDVPSPQPSETK
jgi:hypothetical protein